MDYTNPFTSQQSSYQPLDAYSGETSATGTNSNISPVYQDTDELNLPNHQVDSSGRPYHRQNVYSSIALGGTYCGLAHNPGPQTLGDLVETFFDTPLGQVLLNNQDSELLTDLVPDRTPDRSHVAVKVRSVQTDMNYEQFRNMTTNDYQTLTGQDVSPRFAPKGYTSFPLAFERNPYYLQERQALTIDNLVDGLEVYRNRCEAWIRNFISFIEKVRDMIDFGLEPHHYLSYGQNEDYFFLEAIAPSSTTERVANILANANSSRISIAGVLPVQYNETFHPDPSSGPRNPQYVVPCGLQDFDEDGFELPHQLPQTQARLPVQQSPTPFPSNRGQSRALAREASRRDSSRAMKVTSLRAAQATRQQPTPRIRAAPVTPRISTSGSQSGSSQPPSTMSKPPRKRDRKSMQGSASTTHMRRLAPRPNAESQSFFQTSPASSPLAAGGTDIQWNTPGVMTPIYDRTAHPQFGLTFPAGYVPQAPAYSPSGSSYTTATLSDGDNY